MGKTFATLAMVIERRGVRHRTGEAIDTAADRTASAARRRPARKGRYRRRH